jgi:hypothetical protein
MTLIIGIAGAARSGKDSLAKEIMGHIMVKKDIIKKYKVDEKGNLLVNCVNINDDGSVHEDMGGIDFDTQDPEVFHFLNTVVYPYVKKYAFADPLKWVCREIYGLEHEALYGDSTAKNAMSKYPKKDIFKMLKKRMTDNEMLTNREFMQYLADVMRTVNEKCFVEYTINRIHKEQSELAIISDMRTDSEFEAVKDSGGIVIYLTRRPVLKPGEKVHKTETAMFRRFKDNPSSFDIIVRNKNKSISASNRLAKRHLKEKGYL